MDHHRTARGVMLHPSRRSTAFKVTPSDDVLKQIKDNRHYYAHASGDLRDKAAKDWKLLRYGDLVAALSNLEILTLLGLSDGHDSLGE